MGITFKVRFCRSPREQNGARDILEAT